MARLWQEAGFPRGFMKLNVEMIGGSQAQLSFQSGLIMLHTDYMNAQWHPDYVGVQVLLTMDYVQVGLSNTTGMANHHQTFMFESACYGRILTFFTDLRFPCPNPDPFGLSNGTES